MVIWSYWLSLSVAPCRPEPAARGLLHVLHRQWRLQWTQDAPRQLQCVRGQEGDTVLSSQEVADTHAQSREQENKHTVWHRHLSHTRHTPIKITFTRFIHTHTHSSCEHFRIILKSQTMQSNTHTDTHTHIYRSILTQGPCYVEPSCIALLRNLPLIAHSGNSLLILSGSRVRRRVQFVCVWKAGRGERMCFDKSAVHLPRSAKHGGDKVCVVSPRCDAMALVTPWKPLKAMFTFFNNPNDNERRFPQRK